MNEQLASCGSPEVQLKLTALLKPFTAPILMVYIADCPGIAMALDAGILRVKSITTTVNGNGLAWLAA